MEVTLFNISRQTARAEAVREAETTAGEVTGGTGDRLEMRNLEKALESSQKEAEAAKKEVLFLKRKCESIARDYDRLIKSKYLNHYLLPTIRLMENDKVEKKKTNSMFGWKMN